MDGWGVRPWNWEFSVGVQHEIMPRLSASVGYFRRIQGNFYVMDNEAFAANEFTEFSVTAPGNSLLPSSGNYTVGGFLDPNRHPGTAERDQVRRSVRQAEGALERL